MGESTVLKSGNVSLQVKGFMKSSWQPRFLVLYSGSADSHPHIEIYENQNKFMEIKEAGKKCEKKIDLNRVKCINKSTHKSSRGTEYIIEIQSKKEKHCFSLDDEFESNDWDYRLNKVASILPEKGGESSSKSDTAYGEEVITRNIMYEQASEAVRFEVTVKEERLAKLCDIVGKHTLCISDRELAFEEVGTRRIKYAFHFAWLRKFGRQAEVFLFECGRNCPNGEGEVHCISSDCSKIHDIVTANSCSAAQKAKEVNRAKSMAVQQEAPASTHSHPTYHTLPSHFDSNIGAPSLVTNTARKHPGQIKHPELIPIAPKTSSSSITPPTPKKSVPDSRKSVFSSKDSLKKHGPVSDDFTKELENKILTHPPGEDSTSHTEHDGKSHKDFKRSKEKKKSDREEKKGKNGRKSDKEDKKEKDEKKSKGFFGSKKKEKVEKESKANVPDKLNLYEDPDELIENSNSKENKADEHDTYDEAISSPVRKTPIPEPVEYAQPFARKTTNFQSVDTVMYSDVKDVEDRAWVRHGQENEIHEEDYLNIKNARELKEKEANPPPLPQKLFDFEDETYNTLDLGKTPKANIATTQNIYGTAGAKAVGNLDTVVVPEVTKSESEGSSGDIYEPSDGEEPPLYEGYEAPEAVISKAKTPKSLSQKQQIQPALYEEIPSPPAVNPIRTKQSKFQESVYDEVS